MSIHKYQGNMWIVVYTDIYGTIMYECMYTRQMEQIHFSRACKRPQGNLKKREGMTGEKGKGWLEKMDGGPGGLQNLHITVFFLERFGGVVVCPTSVTYFLKN